MLFDSVHVFARGLEAASLDGPELRIRFGQFVIGRVEGYAKTLLKNTSELRIR